MPKFDMTQEMSVPPQLVGHHTMLMPAPAHVSSQRLMMWGSSHAAQAMSLDNPEFPMWFTGYEAILGKYPFRSAEIREPSIIKAVISRFSKLTSASPAVLIVYVGNQSQTIDYTVVEQTVHLSKEFGYRTRWKNTHLWFTDTPLQPGTEFEEPVCYDGSMYRMGINANVAYMTLPETTTDAFGVSESFVKRLGHTRVGELSVVIPEDALPLNLYGDGVSYKIMPNLNEEVASHGIVLGIRSMAPNCFLADADDVSLHKPQPINDQLYRLPAGTKVVDIEVSLGAKFGRQACNSPMYEQLVNYNSQLISYYCKIVEIYFSLMEQGYTPSQKFNTLVTQAISVIGMETKRGLKLNFRGLAHKQMQRIFGDRSRRDLQFVNKKTPIDFAMVTIKYTYPGMVSLGSKITGRDGAKGVVARIIPDAQMPVDAYGIRADVIACPTGAFNRLNPQQMYEQYIGRVAQAVRKHALSLTDTVAAYAYVLNFFRMLSPTYASIVESHVTSPTAMEEFMVDLEQRGIHYVIPPYTKNRLIQLVPKLHAIYGMDATPVEFDVPKQDGTLQHVRTINPVMIGPKYMVLLCKIPGDDLMAQEASFVNQHRLPVKIHGPTKDTQAVGRTPVRLGEDETMLLSMSVGPEAVVRLLGVQASSPKAFLQLAHELLTVDKPTQLDHIHGMSLKDIVDTSSNVSILNHALGVVGIGLTPPSLVEATPNMETR